MEHINLSIVNTFVDQIALVTRASTLYFFHHRLENTFELARGAITHHIDTTLQPPSTNCTIYSTQLAHALISQAHTHINSAEILHYTCNFLANLGTTLVDCHSWRIRDVELQARLSVQEKKEQRVEVDMWDTRMRMVLGEVITLLGREIEVPGSRMVNGYGYPSPSSPRSVTLEGDIEVGREIEEDMDMNKDTVLLLQQYLHLENHPPKGEHSPTPATSPDFTPEPASFPYHATHSNRCGRSQHFTTAQNKAILLWMKQDSVWSISFHREAYERLLTLPVFASGSEAQGKSQTSGKLRKRVRDKMDKLRGKLVDQGVAEKVESEEDVVKIEGDGDEIETGKKKRKGKARAKVIKRVKTNLVFADWTDEWLEEGWNGKWKRRV